jgi:hypothetical protein
VAVHAELNETGLLCVNDVCAEVDVANRSAAMRLEVEEVIFEEAVRKRCSLRCCLVIVCVCWGETARGTTPVLFQVGEKGQKKIKKIEIKTLKTVFQASLF